jgi:acetyl-CoA C-acetyltransferase
MPEAVIVATARSPIGRAFKGSLKDIRPDDLTAFIVYIIMIIKLPFCVEPPNIHRLPFVSRHEAT